MDIIKKFQSQNNIEFNDEQIKFIHHIYGPALALATAGSGKTTTMCARTLNLILNHNIQPNKILTLTYSNESVDDLKTKFKNLASRKMHLTQQEKVQFSTIHGFALKILYHYANAMGFTYSVLSEIEAHNFLRKCIYNVWGREPSSREAANIKAILNTYKENQRSGVSTVLSYGIVGLNEIAAIYEKMKETENKIDFNDMLHKAYKLLKENSAIRDLMQNKYAFVQVDEAQDISRIQYDIIKLLAQNNPNILLIGDDDQTIYGFRGSDPALLKEYLKDFPNTKQINLGKNYRSTKTIVEVSRKFIEENKIRFEKDIEASKSLEVPIVVKKHTSPKEECSFIINEIKEKYMDNLKETSILYRDNLYVMRLVNELKKNKIPFYIKGDTLSFFSHWLKDDIIAMSLLAADKTYLDAFVHIYNKYELNLDKDHLLTREEVIKIGRNQMESYRRDSIFNVFREMGGFNSKKRKYMEELEKHLDNLVDLRGEAILDYIITDMHYKNYLAKIIDENEHRKYLYLRHVELFKYFLQDHSGVKGLSRKIGELQLLISNAEANKNKNAVFLSTLHSSKGLEFENVFLIGLNHGVIPVVPAASQSSTSTLEEERRLMYVGMTRGKENLYLSSVKKPSEFVTTIQEIIG